MPYVEYDESEAICPHCGSAFRSPEILETHVRESHGGQTTPAARGGSRQVACSLCGAKLSSIAALERHNRSAHMT